MTRISIHNETDYTLTDDMMQYIIRDAQEHFGEEVRAIRVQSGIARHALNARTREVRYAFSPQDFGLGYPKPTTYESLDASAAVSTMDADPEAVIFPVPFEEDEEGMEPIETSLESLDEGQDDEEEDEVLTLDDLIEGAAGDEEDNVLDHEDEEDEWR